ncbi:MAG: hypothetical protein KF764_31675 [Labilithrix sp.]|nr:hypothetical protein [Labilithrix sp.]
MRLMRESLPKVLVVFLTLEGVAFGVAACSSGDDAGPPAPDGGALDEASTTEDAGAADGDAGLPDGAPRVCSDQNFCHTALPVEATLRGVWGHGAIVWAVSEQGDVLRWDGAAWKVHASALGALYAIWGSSETDIWIGGQGGLFHGTGATSQAVTFESVTTPGDEEIPIRSIWGAGAGDVWAVGGNVDDATYMPRARVLRGRAADAGASWSVDPLSSEPLAFSRVWGDNAGGVWIAGDDGSDFAQSSGVYRRAPGADAFEGVAVSAYNDEEGPMQGGPGTLHAGGTGADGRIVLTGRTLSATPSFWFGAATGDAWSYEARDLNDPPLRAVWGIDGGATWVAGDYGRLRSWSGTEWKQAAIMVADFPVIEPLYAMWGTKADDFWIVGKNIAMHRMPRTAP